MRHSTKHHTAEGKDAPPLVDMEHEVLRAFCSNNVRTLLPISAVGIRLLSESFPHVGNAADLDTLADRLSSLRDTAEFGFSALFCPILVDETCQRGIFPMAIGLQGNHYMYAPKLHKKRCLTRLQAHVKGFPDSDDESKGNFVAARVQVSKIYLRERNESTQIASFDVFINRREDVAPVLSLIRAQHGDSWLCCALRACFVHMFAKNDQYRTKIVIVAIRRHQYKKDARENADEQGAQVCSVGEDDLVKEGTLVAGEIGYIVGDIYSSATGAYNMKGAGTLQLAATGEAMRSVGCKVWDLGMSMEYKENVLGCVSIPRKEWLALVREHTTDKSIAEGIDKTLREQYSAGVPVRSLLTAGRKRSTS